MRLEEEEEGGGEGDGEGKGRGSGRVKREEEGQGELDTQSHRQNALLYPCTCTRGKSGKCLSGWIEGY